MNFCYNFLASLHQGDPMWENLCDVLSNLWRIAVLSKVCFFGWRLLLGKLPSRDTLAARGCLEGDHNLVCSLCFSHFESISHLFFSCNVANLAWKEGNMLLVWDFFEAIFRRIGAFRFFFFRCYQRQKVTCGG